MNNPIVKLALGLLLTPTGSFSGYYYLTNIGDTTPILMIVAIIMLPAGLYLLSKTLAPSLATLTAIDTTEKLTPAETAADKARLEATLNKNNDMLATWNKTNKTQDELKMLQIQTNAESAPQ